MSIWTEPKYPGDAVRVLFLIRGGEHGDVRIQQYGTFLKAASFLPGMEESLPGDTPKVWPEKSESVHSTFAADEAFDRLVGEAYADGWQNYNPEVDPPELAEEGGVTIDWSTGRAI